MTGGGGADSGQLDVILHRRFRQGGHQRDQSGERIGDADSRRKSSGEEASCQDGGSGQAGQLEKLHANSDLTKSIC